LLRSLSFVLRRFQVYPLSSSEEDSLDVFCPILLWTDSLSGKMLLEGTDLQRRSRHIDIKVNWLRELLATEILKIGHVRGTATLPVISPSVCQGSKLRAMNYAQNQTREVCIYKRVNVDAYKYIHMRISINIQHNPDTPSKIKNNVVVKNPPNAKLLEIT